jgi:2-phosphoglycolate phosphatase
MFVTPPQINKRFIKSLGFKRPLRAILFDLDGTLVDSFADIANAANHVRSGLGMMPLSISEVKVHVGHGARHLVAGVTDLAPDSHELDVQYSRLLSYYERHPASHAVTFPNAEELLQALRQAHISLAVCTNKPHRVTVPLLERLNLLSTFASVLGEQPGLPPKPDPEMVFQTCQKLRVSPSEALFVGDSPVDIATARRAGMPVIALTHGVHRREELLACSPDLALPDFAALFNHIFLSARPMENRSECPENLATGNNPSS